MQENQKPNAKTSYGKITLRALLLGVLFAAMFAFLTVYFENIHARYLSATQIPVMPYIFLVVVVLLLNPLLKLLGRGIKAVGGGDEGLGGSVFGRLARHLFGPLSAAEIMTVFVMALVSSGVSTFGLASQLVPVVSGLMNRHWNKDQTQWDVYIEPYVNDRFIVAKKGLQKAAVKHVDALHVLDHAKDVLDAAETLQDRKAAVAGAGDELKVREAAVAAGPTEENRAFLAKAKRLLRVAEEALDDAQKRWDKLTADHPDLKTGEVLKTYPARIDELQAEYNIAKQELEQIEEASFKVIDEFRRGLPREKRAIPGFWPVPSEGAAAWFARLQRLQEGPDAKADVEQARALLQQSIDGGGRLPPAFFKHLDQAVERLEPISTAPDLQAQATAVKDQLEEITAAGGKTSRELKDLRQRRRAALSNEFDELDAQIEDLVEARRDQKELQTELRNRSDSLQHQLNIVARVEETQSRLREIKAALTPTSAPPALEAADGELAACIAAFNSFDADLSRYLIGDVPWRHWLRPLFNWAVLILLSYLVLMTLNVLIFRQWAHNEKLIYPLAELPKALVGADSDPNDQTWVPTAYTRGLFWAGVAIAVVFLGWNLLVQHKVLTGVGQIEILTGRGVMWRNYVQGTFLSALAAKFKFHIFFTLVALSFLIPANISGSLTFFEIFFYLQLIVLVALGYGTNYDSFKQSWMLQVNFRTAQGGGALLIFASVIIWKCRHYLFCSVQPKLLSGLEAAEQKELRINSVLFIGGSLGLIAILTWGLGVNLFYSIALYLIVLITSIGLVRAVAEGGILGFQCWFGPGHIGRLIGMDKAWTAPKFFAPVLIYYSVLFLDIKTFIAPAMANAIKIRDDLKMRRLRFHIAIWSGIILAAAIAVIMHIVLAYSRGADNMSGWFYTSFPRSALFNNTIRTIAKTNPVDTSGGMAWLIAGMLLMGLLLYFRRHVFWLPHPIGLIMFVNPIMHTYFLSIFLGWLFKTLVSKYGDKDSYNKIRYLFIGLMIGEILMCMFGYDLNRN